MTTTTTTTTTTAVTSTVAAVVSAAFAADKARGKLAACLKPLFALSASALACELSDVFTVIGEKSKDSEHFSRVANSVAVYARQLNAALSTPLPLFYIGLNRAEKTATVKISEQISAAIIKRELADDLRAQNKALAALQPAKAASTAAPVSSAAPAPAPKVGLSDKHAPGNALSVILEQVSGWREGELQDLQRAIAELIASKAQARLEKAEKAGKVTAAAKTKAATAPEAQKRAKAKAKAKAEAVAVAVA